MAIPNLEKEAVMQYLEPRLAAAIRKSEEEGGIFLENVPNPEQVVIEVHVRDLFLEIALVDVEELTIALRGGEHFPEAELVSLRGSTYGGSVTKVGWIGVGMRLEVNAVKGGFYSFPSIMSVEIKNDETRAIAMRQHAQTVAPPPMTEGERAQEQTTSIREFLEDYFPEGDIRTRAKEMVDRFSFPGKIVIITLLSYAYEEEKFEGAMELLEKFYKEHWQYQHPAVRGDIEFLPTNNAYLVRAYQELGIKMPSER